jgi:hypothetical protein
MSDELKKLLLANGLDECDDAVAHIETLEHTLDRVAAVLRLLLKYNTAMHGGAAAHNQRLLDTLAEIERVRGARADELRGETHV